MASQRALFSSTCSSSSLGSSRAFSTSCGLFAATQTKPRPTYGNSTSPSFSQSPPGPRTQFTVHKQRERGQWSSQNPHRSREGPGQSRAGTLQNFGQPPARQPRNGNKFQRQPERRSAPSWDLEPTARPHTSSRQQSLQGPVRRDAQGRVILDRGLPHITRENQPRGRRDSQPPARLKVQRIPAPVSDVENITADEMNDIMGGDAFSSIPMDEVRDTRDVFHAVKPSMVRETHARRLSEKSAVKGQRLPRERPHTYQTEVEVLRPKRVAKLAPIKLLREVYLPKLVTIGNLAKILNVRLAPLQRALLKAGFEDVNYDHLLTADDAALIAPDFGCNAFMNEEAAFDIYPPPQPEDLASLPIRPPVVAIMGHVDHGKTTLLDTLRSASVAKGEAGGITQHIGAFSLPVSSLSTGSSKKDDRAITFLDTPGHAAFSAMRARGTKCTDVVVLVVAADDGVMPQTREVIELVKKDGGDVGLVVAINKVDKPEADVERVKNMLLAEGVPLDGYGGEVPYVEVSGLTGKGLDNLMETISLVSELMELRAEHEGTAVGYILESNIVKGFGSVATVLLLRGDLTPGSYLVAGTVGCRVRSITDHTGKTLRSAHPGTAVTVSGWKELPKAGDEVIQGRNEEEVKRAITNRKRQEELNSVVEDVDAINHKRKLERERREAQLAALKSGKVKPNAPKPLFSPEIREDDNRAKELKLVIKADVTGSAEAVAGALQGIGNDKASSKVVSSNVGDVTEGDVALAKAIGATIIAFSVNTPRPILQMAASQNVTILTSSVIYHLMEEVQEKVISLLPRIIEHHVRGEATVSQQFEISMKHRQVLKVAGCKVSNGIIERQRQARLIRNGKTIFEGTLESLKHLKNEVTEMRKGTECGIAITGWKQDFLPGDIIQMYETVTKPGLL